MITRRGFFTGQQKELKIRPPYGKEDDFLSTCIKCETKECVKSCETSIIYLDENKTPYLNFKDAGCTFCEDCAHVCPHGVLSLENTHTIKAKFEILKNSCLAYDGVICSLCKDPCLDDAISFNGMFSPVIDQNKCTSCGYCMGKCPNSSIIIKTI